MTSGQQARAEYAPKYEALLAREEQALEAYRADKLSHAEWVAVYQQIADERKKLNASLVRRINRLSKVRKVLN